MVNNIYISNNKNIDNNLYYKNYDNLSDDIFILEIKITRLEYELSILIGGPQDVKAQSYELKNHQSNYKDITEIYILIETKSKEIAELKQELKTLKQTKKQIEENFMITLNQTERQVFKMRNKILQNGSKMTLDDIAFRLGKNDSHIRRVSGQIDSKMITWLCSLVPTNIDF